MSQVLLYLKLDDYLAQWFVHNVGNGQQPVRLPKGCHESDILERFLQTSVPGRPGDVSSEDSNVSIQIPTFKTKPPVYYNYLAPKARKLLEKAIYVRFRVQLWQDLHRLDNSETMISELVWAWMEANGIEDDPKNFETIRQQYFRKRQVYRNRIAREQKKKNSSNVEEQPNDYEDDEEC